MKKAVYFFFTIFSLFFVTNVNAQTPLTPGTLTFDVQPIFLRGEGIYLSGNSSYIAAYVQAYYPDFSYKMIGMDCYLNGDEFTATQNCSVQFYPEKGICTILSPVYKPLHEMNEIKCKIYDPENKAITSTYINKTFLPLNFSAWIHEYSTLVGEEFNFPIIIKNYGLFKDVYKIKVCVKTGTSECRASSPGAIVLSPTEFEVELNGDTFDPDFWNQTGHGVKEVYAKLMILDASVNSYVYVNITSSLNSTIFKQLTATITAKARSLSELNLPEIILLFLLATVFIFKFKSKLGP